MRTLAMVLLVGFICLIGGFYAGSGLCQRARLASAPAALRRATEAMTVGRQDEALQFAFAALDRDPGLYAAYELAGDAVTTPQRNALPLHLYRAALAGAGNAAQRTRIQEKIAALGYAQ
jgi:hypothetical protein